MYGPRRLGTARLFEEDEDLRVRCGATTHPPLTTEAFMTHANGLIVDEGVAGV